MAGVFIEVDAQSFARAERYLQRIITAGQSLEPAFEQIGDYLIASTQDRRSTEQSPDGTPWEPLSPVTIERKGHDRILEDKGILFDMLAFQITGDTLTFGSNEVYAAIQQFGGTTSPNSMFPNTTIPAREFIGISDTDEDEIVAILKDHLQS